MKRGFTLIELMVVITLVVLLTIGSIYFLSVANERRQTKTTVEKVKSIIEQAVSMARIPSDTEFGLEKIQIRIIIGEPNEVKVYRIYKNNNPTPTEETKLYYKVPDGVYLIDDKLPNNNMTKLPDPNNPANSYYYFSVDAKGSQIGQLTDTPNSVYPVFFNVFNKSGINDADYKITVFPDSGMVTTEKMP